MKVLITGSSGFIGKKILDAFKVDKSLKIILTTRKKGINDKNLRYYDIFSCDYDRNLFDYFNKPDVILHCAWDNVKDVNDSKHQNEQVYHHIKFLENLIKNGIKKVVVLGSCFEYGKAEGEVSEHLCNVPITNYGIAKDLLRKHLDSLIIEYNFIFQWIRIFYAYDKTGKSGNNIVYYLRKAIESNHNSFDMTYGQKELDFIEINDISQNVKKILMQDEIRGVINCCSGKPQTTLTLVKKCLKDWDKQIKLNKGYIKYRDFEPDYQYGSINKLNSIL